MSFPGRAKNAQPRLAAVSSRGSVRAVTLMKLHSLLRIAALMAVLGLVPVSAATVGQPAPQFSLPDLNGQTVSLEEHRGKVVVLEWVNPECPFVVRHYRSGNMPALQREMREQGVVWITVNSGSQGEQGDYAPAAAMDWMKKVEASPTAYLRDTAGEVGRLYKAKTTPHMYVIDPQGTLVYQGAIDSNRRSHEGAENYVRAAVTAIKAGTAPAKTNTEPYGCGIKY